VDHVDDLVRSVALARIVGAHHLHPGIHVQLF
jgi:hypothetical protein